MKSKPNFESKQLKELCFNEILSRKGCVIIGTFKLGFSQDYVFPTLFKVHSVIIRFFLQNTHHSSPL